MGIAMIVVATFNKIGPSGQSLLFAALAAGVVGALVGSIAKNPGSSLAASALAVVVGVLFLLGGNSAGGLDPFVLGSLVFFGPLFGLLGAAAWIVSSSLRAALSGPDRRKGARASSADGNSEPPRQPEPASPPSENVTPSLANAPGGSRCPACGEGITADNERCPSCDIAFVADGPQKWTPANAGPADGIRLPPTQVRE